MTTTLKTLERETPRRNAGAARPALKERLNNLGMRAAGRAGTVLRTLFGDRCGGKLGVLTYHRVSPHVPDLPAPLHNVPPARFRQQLAGLLDAGYTVWPLARVLQHRLDNRTVPPQTIVVTFDDGFRSVYTHAWPVLRELNVPATIFVNTAYLDSDEPFPFDAWGMAYSDDAPLDSFAPLTTGQCREMAATGLVEIGAHTHTHEDFRGRPEAFRDDTQLSVEIVRSRFGGARITFAFPFGSPYRGFAGGELARAAKETDAACALTTEAELVDVASDPFYWGRFNVFPWDTASTINAKLSGWYSWAPRLRHRFCKRNSWDGMLQSSAVVECSDE